MRYNALIKGLMGLSFFLAMAMPVASQVITLDADTQLSYARTLYDEGAFDEAAVEFSRFTHFFPEAPNIGAAHYGRALSLYMGGAYLRSEAAFAAFREHFKGSPLVLASGIMEAQCRTRLGDPTGGVVLLTNLKREFKGDSDALRILLSRMAWTRLEMGDLPRAEADFIAAAEAMPASCGYGEILKAMDRFKALPEKSPRLAGGLALIPGAGYLYLGRYQDATVTLLLNLALGLAAVDSFDDGHNALGALISFVGFGFYSGSIHGSYTGALKENRQMRQSLWEEMRHWGQELEGKQPGRCLGLTLTIPY